MGAGVAVILELLIILVAAKVAAEVAERVGVPAVLGEIGAGLLIGPHALGLVGDGEVVRFLAELGVIVLLLQVGLELDLGELRAVGVSAGLVAVAGVALPFAGVLALGPAIGADDSALLFVAGALTATSVGITARVFADLRALASSEARTVLSAAVADDVLGLVLLTIVTKLAAGGGVSALGLAGVVAVAVGFLVVSTAVATRTVPPLALAVARGSRSSGSLLAFALVCTLALAYLAHAAGLAALIGAFVAGLALGRANDAERVRREVTSLGHVFVPIFFVHIGLQTELSRLADPAVLRIAGLLLVVGVAGKVAAGAVASRRAGDRLLIGLGMLPRGEVGLIFAGIGLREGLLDGDLYGAVLLVVLATTVVAPPLLRMRMGVGRSRPAPAASAPLGGYLALGDGVVRLRAVPPPAEAAGVALDAAVEVAYLRPASNLLDWLGSAPEMPWGRQTTERLLRVLRTGNARTWRFLDTTAVLDRLLPELADAVARRRLDASELDPLRVLTWERVSAVRAMADAQPVDSAAAAEYARLAQPDLLLLAALFCDAIPGDRDRTSAARSLAQRLELGADAVEEVVLLVTDHALFRAAIRRQGWRDERAVLNLAGHIQTEERARALYLLSVAEDDFDVVSRARLDQLHGAVQQVLADTALSGGRARTADEIRRQQARALAPAAAGARIDAAPRSWVLALEPAAVARVCTLLVHASARGEVRAAVHATATGWTVDVGCRDAQGLLARVTGVLAADGGSVRHAVTATWPDGVAAMTFDVGGGRLPLADEIARRILAAPASGSWHPVPDAVVSFDGDASPWYTVCEIAAPDRPGLLHDLTAAISAAGVSIHLAQVSTGRDGWAHDVFELTDHRGAKISDAAQAAIAAALRGGRRRRAKPFGRAHKLATEPKHLGHTVETAAP